MKEEILEVIKRAGKSGILQGELSGVYGFSKSTVSMALKDLLNRGLVVRRKVAGKSYRLWSIENSPYPQKGHLRIGILKAIEYPAILLVYRDCKKVKIHLKLYNNAFNLTKDLAEGYLDVGCSPLITQTLFALVYRTLRINAGCGYNGGGLIIRKKGDIFGSSELSTMEYNLYRYMERKGIHGVVRHFSSPERMIRALEKDEVHAIAIWEPYLTRLSKKYKMLRFEELFGDYPCCTLASNIAVENTEEFASFLRYYRKAFHMIEERKEELIKLESKLFKISQRDIREAFYGFKYSFELSIELARETLQSFGLKLSEDSERKIFNLL